MDDNSVEIEGLEKETAFRSISGAELPKGWPQILKPEEEIRAYKLLRDEGDNPEEPSKNSHIERLSYELISGDKRLRFFATFHQRDMKPNDSNLVQYEILEKKFKESPPQLVLYEGYIDDVNYPLTRERALSLGEPAWMCYLVQQHNANLKEGEKPIVIESGDAPVNNEPDNQRRDLYIVKKVAEKFREYDRVDMVFGSGHAIREKHAWEEFFDHQS